MKFIKNTLSIFDVRTFFLFLAILFVPFIYQDIIRILVSNLKVVHMLEEIHHYSLHFNFVWLAFIFIVIAETFYFPLISLIGDDLKKGHDNKIGEHLNTILKPMILVIGVAIIICFIVVTASFDFFHPESHAKSETLFYLYFEILAIAVIAINQVLQVVFHMKNKVVLLIIMVTQLVLLITGDLIMIYAEVSAHYASLFKLISSLIVLGISIVVLFKMNINIFLGKFNKKYFIHFFHLAHHAFIDAVLIDLALILLISKFGIMNSTYTLILGVLLFPMTAFGMMIRFNEATRSTKEMADRWLGYTFYQLFFIAFTLIFAVVFFDSIGNILGAHFFGTEATYLIVKNELFFKLPVIVIILARGLMMVNNSIFYGTGKLGNLTNQAVTYSFVIFLPTLIGFLVNGSSLGDKGDYVMLVIYALGMFVGCALSFYQIKKELPKFEHEVEEHH